jgi:hypothetical protein
MLAIWLTLEKCLNTAPKAIILFDTGASANFVSKSFAKQTGITVRPVDYAVRLADDKTMNVAGEATVYVQLGSFHKPVKCSVMDMLYEVDLILGEAFMLKYDCILHYGKCNDRGPYHRTTAPKRMQRHFLAAELLYI